jgi:DNA helicase-2/ATP-dependent DNA helicase PcrA
VLPEKQFEMRAPARGDRWGGSPGWSSGVGRAPQADRDRYPTPVKRESFEKARPDEHPFAIGQNVRHAKFGDGVVINTEGRGLDARVQVRFATEGTKWLALQFARLTAAD